jgi:hypothetical protein
LLCFSLQAWHSPGETRTPPPLGYTLGFHGFIQAILTNQPIPFFVNKVILGDNVLKMAVAHNLITAPTNTAFRLLKLFTANVASPGDNLLRFSHFKLQGEASQAWLLKNITIESSYGVFCHPPG